MKRVRVKSLDHLECKLEREQKFGEARGGVAREGALAGEPL